MNEIVNKFLLVGNKFTPERHLKQPGFTYSACGSFTKNKERIEGFLRIFKDMTAVSKNIYFHVLDDIVNKYNNTVHRSIKIKPINVTSDSYAEYNENFNKNILNLKLAIMLGLQNTRIFLLKDTLQIGQKKILLLTKLKMQSRGHMPLMI